MNYELNKEQAELIRRVLDREYLTIDIEEYKDEFDMYLQMKEDKLVAEQIVEIMKED